MSKFEHKRYKLNDLYMPCEWWRNLNDLSHIQPYPLIFKALLYGVDCRDISIVPLLLDHGITTMISLDDLATDWWLKGGPYNGRMGNNLTDLSLNRTTLRTLPNIELDNAYTIFRPDFPITKNNLLEQFSRNIYQGISRFCLLGYWQNILRLEKKTQSAHLRYSEISKILLRGFCDLAIDNVWKVAWAVRNSCCKCGGEENWRWAVTDNWQKWQQELLDVDHGV